jgi:hypothetical protein
MAGEGGIDDKLAPHDFVADFVWAARAVLSQPSIAVVSIVLWCLPIVLRLLVPRDRSIMILGSLLFLVLFCLGWLGAEREFFRSRREGKVVELRDLLMAVPDYIGPFLRLGVRVGIVAFPIWLGVGFILGRFDPAASAASHTAARRISLIVVMVPVDLALTFVPSALVFSTRSSGEALRIGLGLIRRTWPRSGLYVLCPPLALNMLNSIYPTHITAVRLASAAGLAVLALLAKGATAAFYLRERPVSPDAAPSLV